MSLNTNTHQYVYVSNAKSGTITRYLLDAQAGKLKELGRTKAGDNVMPLAVSPDKNHLYASVRSEPFRVVTYLIDPNNADLTAECEANLPASMANIATDKTGRFLFAASYGGHRISVSPIDAQGVITKEAHQVLQTGRNAHAIHPSPDNKFVFSTALGDDEIMQYRFDQESGQLTPNTPSSVKTSHHSGPRHFFFSPNGQFLYVLGELSGTVFTFAYDAATGLLTLKGETQGVPTQELSLENGVPPSVEASNDNPKVWTADMHMSPDGRFMYVSERTRSVITTLTVDSETGLPSYQGMTQVETQPRGFALSNDGRFMVVSGERAAHLGLYAMDEVTGQPSKVDEAPTDEGANWVEMLTLPVL